MRADIAKLFCDLRRAIGASPMQVSMQLHTHAGVIAALERGDVDALPAWPETTRVVLAYAAWAGIDGRPVLTVIAALMRDVEAHRRTAAQYAAVRPAVAASAEKLRLAGINLAKGASRLPRQALMSARERPARTFYALSLPLGLLLIGLNSGLLQTAVSHVPRPIMQAAAAVKDTLAVYFPPVREGLRWIDVDNPRTRRSDRLPPTGH